MAPSRAARPGSRGGTGLAGGSHDIRGHPSEHRRRAARDGWRSYWASGSGPSPKADGSGVAPVRPFRRGHLRGGGRCLPDPDVLHPRARRGGALRHPRAGQGLLGIRQRHDPADRCRVPRGARRRAVRVGPADWARRGEPVLAGRRSASSTASSWSTASSPQPSPATRRARACCIRWRSRWPRPPARGRAIRHAGASVRC